MPSEIASYLRWKGSQASEPLEIEIVQEKPSELTVSDADSDVLFDEEKKPLTLTEYEKLKLLALKSTQDFLTLYQAIDVYKRQGRCNPDY